MILQQQQFTHLPFSNRYASLCFGSNVFVTILIATAVLPSPLKGGGNGLPLFFLINQLICSNKFTNIHKHQYNHLDIL